ncbi:hypothetical protein OF83DRAFT_1087615, partial [Amylostereum chailletii]
EDLPDAPPDSAAYRAYLVSLSSEAGEELWDDVAKADWALERECELARLEGENRLLRRLLGEKVEDPPGVGADERERREGSSGERGMAEDGRMSAVPTVASNAMSRIAMWSVEGEEPERTMKYRCRRDESNSQVSFIGLCSWLGDLRVGCYTDATPILGNIEYQRTKGIDVNSMGCDEVHGRRRRIRIAGKPSQLEEIGDCRQSADKLKATKMGVFQRLHVSECGGKTIGQGQGFDVWEGAEQNDRIW